MAEPEGTPQQRAEVLKERIYITFTSLAVVLALRSHADELTAGGAAVTLLIAVTGTLLAVFVADLVAHIAVHTTLPDRAEFAHMASVSTRALGVIVAPMIMIGLAGLGVWKIGQALQVATIVLIVSLVAIGYLAVRRIRLPLRQRLFVLFAEFALGVVVVLLELLAHGA
jgi:hypothetical protein